MFTVDAIKSQIESFLSEIARIEGVEFPYPHSNLALQKLKGLFEAQRRNLESLPPGGAPSLIQSSCESAAQLVRDSSQVLGFILRSTNIRNAFEAYGPILRLSRKLLHSDSRLIISSEWEFSPFVFIGLNYLKDFVLIGLPATESENPFIIPLSGHELGHTVWKHHDLEKEIQSILKEYIIEEQRKRQDRGEYARIFPADKEREIERNLRRATLWASAQSQEVFCDLLGLRVFAESYLYSFAYLLAPPYGFPRSEMYPDLKDRVSILITASKQWGIGIPDGYLTWWNTSRAKTESNEKREYLLSLADNARSRIEEVIIKKCEEVVTGMPEELHDPTTIDVNLQYLKYVVPIQNARNISDIINAGWKARLSADFFPDSKFNADSTRHLRELLLKSFEIYEYESRLKN